MAKGLQALQGMGGYSPQSYVLGGGKQRGGLGSFFLGKKPSVSQISTVTPEVSAALSQLLQQSLSGIQNPYEGFEPIEQESVRGFKENIIPSIMERFTSLGAGGSSALNQQLAQAGKGLQQSIDAQKAQYGLQNRQGLMQLLQLALMPQFENAFMQGGGGFLGGLGKGLVGAGSQALGTYLGISPLTNALQALAPR